MRKFFTKKRKDQIHLLFILVVLGALTIWHFHAGFFYNPAAENNILVLSGTFQSMQSGTVSGRFTHYQQYYISLDEYPNLFITDNRSDDFRYNAFVREVKRGDKINLIVDKKVLYHPRFSIFGSDYKLIAAYSIISQDHVYLSLDDQRKHFRKDRLFAFPLALFFGWCFITMIFQEYRGLSRKEKTERRGQVSSHEEADK